MLFITYNQFIDSFACVEKFCIDQTDLHPFPKEILKLTIDDVADYLKEAVNRDIASIRSVAFMCGVQKVVAIPYCLSYGEKILFLRAYGGNSNQFFSSFGLSPIPQKNNENFYKELEMIEHNYGVIIYS